MNITSPAFDNSGAVPSEYTCDGANVNPPLVMSGVPTAAKSLALIVDDPDAPRGTWVHWTLWNIDPQTTEIKEHSVPPGAIEGVTSFGKPGYGGPCPPSGTHHYHFKLYALDTQMALDASADKARLEAAISGHVIAFHELIGLYARK